MPDHDTDISSDTNRTDGHDDNPPPRPSGQQPGGRQPGGKRTGDDGDGKRKSEDGGDDKGGDDESKGEDGGDDDDKEPKKPSPLKKPWVRVAIVLVVLLLLIAAGIWFYRYWTHGRFVEETNNAYLQADQVVVSSRIAGAVEEVFVGDNEQVTVGQRLLRIDDRASRARVAQAEAQAVQGRASMRQYESQINEQRAAIAQSLAQAEGSRAQLRYAAGEVQRYAPLAATGAERPEKLAQLASNRDQALATLRQSDASVAQARRRVATLQAQTQVGAAQVAQAEAEARQAQVDVDSALILATVAGRVGDRQVRVGQYAQPGTRLLTVVPVQSIYLVANFKETQIGLMRVGQPATIKVDALDGEKLSGSVDSFAPATGAQFALIPPNNATGNFTKIVQRVPVRIRIDATPEAERVLVPGLSVEVSVDTLGSKEDAERRKQENKDNREAGKERMKEGVERDRQRSSHEGGQPSASGAGR